MRLWSLSLAGICLSIGAASAGQPSISLLKLRQVVVEACEPIAVEVLPQAMHSTSLSEDDLRVAIAEAELVAIARVRILLHRDVGESYEDPDAPSTDTGWMKHCEGDATFDIALVGQESACDLLRRDLAFIVVDDRNECDTDPPQGRCVFHPVGWVAGKELTARYAFP